MVMTLAGLVLLITPGVIATRLFYFIIGKTEEKFRVVACDYLILTFTIFTLTNSVMFISDPHRSINLDVLGKIGSDIYRSSFIFKFGMISFFWALVVGFLFSFTKLNPIIFFQELWKNNKNNEKKEKSLK